MSRAATNYADEMRSIILGTDRPQKAQGAASRLRDRDWLVELDPRTKPSPSPAPAAVSTQQAPQPQTPPPGASSLGAKAWDAVKGFGSELANVPGQIEGGAHDLLAGIGRFAGGVGRTVQGWDIPVISKEVGDRLVQSEQGLTGGTATPFGPGVGPQVRDVPPAAGFSRYARQVAPIAGGVATTLATGGLGAGPVLAGAAGAASAMTIPVMGETFDELKDRPVSEQWKVAAQRGAVAQAFGMLNLDKVLPAFLRGPAEKALGDVMGGAASRTLGRAVAQDLKQEGKTAAEAAVIGAGQVFADHLVRSLNGLDKAKPVDELIAEAVDAAAQNVVGVGAARMVGRGIQQLRGESAAQHGKQTADSFPSETNTERSVSETTAPAREPTPRPGDGESVIDQAAREPGGDAVGSDPVAPPARTATPNVAPATPDVASSGTAFGERLNLPATRYFGEMTPQEARAEGFGEMKARGERPAAVLKAQQEADSTGLDHAVVKQPDGLYDVVARTEKPSQGRNTGKGLTGSSSSGDTSDPSRSAGRPLGEFDRRAEESRRMAESSLSADDSENTPGQRRSLGAAPSDDTSNPSRTVRTPVPQPEAKASVASRIAAAAGRVAERSGARATEIVREYDATIAKARREGGPAARVGATLPPEYLWHRATEVAARALQRGITTGQKLTDFVREHAATFPKGTGDQFNALHRAVKAIISRTRAPDGTHPIERFDAAVADVRDLIAERGGAGKGASVKGTIAQATGMAPAPKTVTEPGALGASMKAQARGAREGFRAGREAERAAQAARDAPTVKETIAASTGLAKGPKTVTERDALRAALKKSQRDSAAAYRAGVKDRGEKAKQEISRIKADALAKDASVQALRDRLTDTVEDALPPSIRGKMLRAVQRARTPADVHRAGERIETLAAAHDARAAVRSLEKRAGSPEKLRTRFKLTEPERAQVAGHLETARKARDAVRAEQAKNRPDWVAMRDKANEAADAVNEVKAVIHDRTMAEKVRIGRRLQGIADVQRPIEANLRRVRPVRKGDAPDVGFARRQLNDQLDNRSLALDLDNNDPRGPVNRVLVKGQRRAENAALWVEREAARRGDELVKRAGYKGWGDFLAKASGTMGEANQRKIGVKLGGRELTLGEGLEFLAHDPDTVALDAAGQKYNFDDHRNGSPAAAGDDLRREIAAAVGPENVKLVRELKDLRNELVGADLRKAHRELLGYDMKEVADQWPRNRNSEASDTSKAPTGWRGQLRAHLENSGRLKERTTDTRLALLVKDFPTKWLSTVKAEAAIAHQAEATRTAEMTLLTGDTRRLIADKFGESAVKQLQGAIDRGSTLPDQPTTADKALDQFRRWIGSAQVAFNVTTAAKQFTGVFKLLGELSPVDIAYGLAHAASRATMDRMTKGSPWLWKRYAQSAQHLISSVGSDASTFSAPGVKQAFIAAVRSAQGAATLARPKGAMDLLTTNIPALFDQVRMMSAADSVPARVAFHAALNESRRTKPQRTEAQHEAYAARKAEQVMRDTQNSYGPNDSAAWLGRYGRSARGRLLSMFTSDASKTFNRAYQATRLMKTDPARASEMLAGVGLSLLGSAGVQMALSGAGLAYLYGSTRGDMSPDKREELRDAMKRAGVRELGGAVGAMLLAPWGGGGLFTSEVGSVLLQKFGGWDANEIDLQTPVGSASLEGFKAGMRLVGAVMKRLNAQTGWSRDKANQEILRAAYGAAMKGSTLVGLPAEVTVGRAMGAVDRYEKTPPPARQTLPKALDLIRNGDHAAAAARMAPYLASFAPGRDRAVAAARLRDLIGDQSDMQKISNAEFEQLPWPRKKELLDANNRWMNTMHKAVNAALQEADRRNPWRPGSATAPAPAR